ncbi:MAG TPA: nuclear transport factor 2 family protein [Gemmatimonadales bacterium]|nr:nuclear transport factor 2 family protein [Gemmatimonadales bacterium]
MTDSRLRRIAPSLLVAVMLLATACTLERREPPPSTGSEARAAVLAELRSYYTDLSARDWPAFASHFWPGATITTAWQPPGEPFVRVDAQTIPEFIERAPEGPDSRAVFSEELVSADIRVTGGLAQAWVRYRARFGDPGDIAEWEGTDAFSLLAVDGQWKIVSLAFASDR